jgi:hypothetical protein
MVVLILSPVAACAPSAKISYARHLSAKIEPGPATDDDVAVAFRLDAFSEPTTAIAAVERIDSPIDAGR